MDAGGEGWGGLFCTRTSFSPLDPLEGPVGLLGDAWNVLHRLEQVLLLRAILDVGVDEERVHLCDKKKMKRTERRKGKRDR